MINTPVFYDEECQWIADKDGRPFAEGVNRDVAPEIVNALNANDGMRETLERIENEAREILDNRAYQIDRTVVTRIRELLDREFPQAEPTDNK